MNTVRLSGSDESIVFDKRLLERPLAFARCSLEQARDCCFVYRLEGAAPKPGCFGLHVVLSGEGRMTVGPDEIPMPGRSCLMTAPGEGWTFHASGGDEPVRLVTLTIRLLPGNGNPFAELADKEAFSGGAALTAEAGDFAQPALELLKELESRDPLAPTMTESSLYRLLGQVCRARSGNRRRTESAAPGKADLVYETVRYIDRRLTEIRELGEIADALGYSYSRLSHVFRSEMGVSLQTYWNRRRIMRAMALLQAGETSITGAAERLRYQSVHSISKSFNKISGLSPSDYLELYGKARKTLSY